MNNVLFIEPSLEDLLSLKSLLRQSGVINPIHQVHSFPDALLYLQGQKPFQDRSVHPLPSVIFLDIHLEGHIGFKLLQWIKRQPYLSDGSVIICSELTSIADLHKCYRYGALTFLLKPFQTRDVQNLIQHFPSLWQLRPGLPAHDLADCGELVSI